MTIKYLHTMVRVKDLEKSMAFYRLLGLKETRRHESEQGRFTLVPPRRDALHPLEPTLGAPARRGLAEHSAPSDA